MRTCIHCHTIAGETTKDGDPICGRCKSILANNPVVTDEKKELQDNICNHPRPYNNRNRCKWCDKKMEE